MSSQLGVSIPAAADPIVPDPASKASWYEGKLGHRRLVHLGITTAIGLSYALSETVFKSSLAASSCRWCEPPGFDCSVRNAVVWDDPGRANLLSNLDGYVLAPVVGFGLLIAADHDAGWARLIDDTLPVAEAVAVSEAFTQVIKFAVGRQRPYRHFGDQSLPGGADDNTSFISGHSDLGFTITAGAGIICHWRHYWTEPYVWGAGIRALGLDRVPPHGRGQALPQ